MYLFPLKKCSSGIVGIGDEENAGFFAQRGENRIERELHLVGIAQDGDSSAVNLRIVAVHRERRLANQDAVAGIDERVEENAQSIVSTICKQKLLRTYAKIARQSFSWRLVFRIH